MWVFRKYLPDKDHNTLGEMSDARPHPSSSQKIETIFNLTFWIADGRVTTKFYIYFFKVEINGHFYIPFLVQFKQEVCLYAAEDNINTEITKEHFIYQS